jgi:hypothetical protein
VNIYHLGDINSSIMHTTRYHVYAMRAEMQGTIAAATSSGPISPADLTIYAISIRYQNHIRVRLGFQYRNHDSIVFRQCRATTLNGQCQNIVPLFVLYFVAIPYKYCPVSNSMLFWYSTGLLFRYRLLRDRTVEILLVLSSISFQYP